jgi:hypothetical protein
MAPAGRRFKRRDVSSHARQRPKSALVRHRNPTSITFTSTRRSTTTRSMCGMGHIPGFAARSGSVPIRSIGPALLTRKAPGSVNDDGFRSRSTHPTCLPNESACRDDYVPRIADVKSNSGLSHPINSRSSGTIEQFFLIHFCSWKYSAYLSILLQGRSKEDLGKPWGISLLIMTLSNGT